jgi:hypothetical protein
MKFDLNYMHQRSKFNNFTPEFKYRPTGYVMCVIFAVDNNLKIV